MMPAWIAKAVVLAATVAMIAIRAPHGQRSRSVKTIKSGKSTRETVVLIGLWIGFFIPLIWIVSPVLSFADYPLHRGPFAAGVVLILVGLWLLHRSHVDLGTKWSVTLEVREQHRLITQGIYRRVRHPMYLALLLHSIGQALVLPNWLAGPSYIVPFTILFSCRVRAEERMMLEQFGDDYAAYMARSKRLIPGLW
jgi:protein-S-isoprenylcysteine O-methyltransferase Ste14